MMRKYLFLVLFGFCFAQVSAQNPNWSVNASNYQYSMTFTTFLNVNGTTLSSVDDKVAANFCPINPDFPIPVTTTLLFDTLLSSN